jgi:hypothetical protein
VIEKLTESERIWLAAPGPQTWPNITAKALRIIDALTAALAQAVERNDEDVKCLLEAREAIAQRDAALARAEAAERELDEVRIELGEERKRYRAAEQNVVWNRSDRDRAESEAAALRAEVERLKAEREAELEARGRYGFATAERLAAAEALLRMHTPHPPHPAVAAFLSPQPAASAAPRGVHVAHPAQQMAIDAFRREQAPCTAEERAVLSAVAAAPERIVQAWLDIPAGIGGFYHDLGVAERARRAAKGAE